MGGMPGMGPWGMLLWGLVALAILVLLVVSIVWLVRSLMSGNGGRRGDADNAEDILRRRYAAGEISREEFLRLREDLRPH